MNTPDFTPPELLARLGPRLPQRPWSVALALALNSARALGKLPEDLSFLEERKVAINISDFGATATLRFSKGRFAHASGAPDVRFSACLTDLLRVMRREEDPDTLFFQRRLRIEGDTELGLQLKNLLDSIELPGWITRQH